MNGGKKIRLCITSLYSYPLFKPACEMPFGGSEVRISLIAKELAKKEIFDVNMVVWDHDQADSECIEGVTIHPWKGRRCPAKVIPEAGQTTNEDSFRQKIIHWLKKNQPSVIKNIRLFFYRSLRYLYYRLIKENPIVILGRIGEHAVMKADVEIYDEIDADIYMIHGNTIPTAELALYCRKKGKKLVFLAASDADFDADYKANPQAIGRLGQPGNIMVFSIENADEIIVQNMNQQDLLKNVYHRDAVVIRNPVDLDRKFNGPVKKNNVLWVGKSDWIKRPEIIIELARSFPSFEFTLIMNYSARNVYERCLEMMESLSNVELLIYVPFDEVEKYFSQAKFFINTSVFEGFPNTFLQAAKYGVPIISYNVDPGEMLSKHGCGLLCDSNFEKMKSNFSSLISDANLYLDISNKCIEYIHHHHEKGKILAEYERILKTLI